MKIAFFGLPLAALLLEHDGHELVLVALSRTDTVGVRRARARFGDRLLERPKVDDPRLARRIELAAPDLLVSWFWTTRLPMRLVDLCEQGGFGVHPSLLPRHRGPDPYFWAIERGDAVTGVTAHRIAAEYDTGAMLGRRELAIDPSWNAWRLARALDRPSLMLLREVAGRFAQGDPPGEHEQDESLATEAPSPDDELCELRFEGSTEQVLRRIKALAPAPGAFTEIGDEVVTIVRAEAAAHYPRALAPGEAAVVEGRAVVRTRDGAVALLEGEIEGERAGVDDLAAVVERARAAATR